MAAVRGGISVSGCVYCIRRHGRFTMVENPIAEEVHRIREEMPAEYGGDLKAIIQAMREKTEEAARSGRKVVSLPPRPVQGQGSPARKVG